MESANNLGETITLQLTQNLTINIRVYIRRTHYPINDINQAICFGNALCMLSFSTESCPFEVMIDIDSPKRIRKEVTCHVSLCDQTGKLVHSGLKHQKGEATDFIEFSGLKRKLCSTKFGINKSSFSQNGTSLSQPSSDQNATPMHFKVSMRGRGNYEFVELKTPSFFVYSKIPGNVSSKDYVLSHLRDHAESIQFKTEEPALPCDTDKRRSTVLFHLSKTYTRVPFSSISKLLIENRAESVQVDSIGSIDSKPCKEDEETGTERYSLHAVANQPHSDCRETEQKIISCDCNSKSEFTTPMIVERKLKSARLVPDSSGVCHDVATVPKYKSSSLMSNWDRNTIRPGETEGMFLPRLVDLQVGYPTTAFENPILPPLRFDVSQPVICKAQDAPKNSPFNWYKKILCHEQDYSNQMSEFSSTALCAGKRRSQSYKRKFEPMNQGDSETETETCSEHTERVSKSPTSLVEM